MSQCTPKHTCSTCFAVLSLGSYLGDVCCHVPWVGILIFPFLSSMSWANSSNFCFLVFFFVSTKIEETNLYSPLKQWFLFWSYPICSLGNSVVLCRNLCRNLAFLHLLGTPRDNLHLVNMSIFPMTCLQNYAMYFLIYWWLELERFYELILNVIRCQ